MNLLQSLVLPGLDLPGAEEMYVRANPLAWPELNERRLRFRPGGCITTDTFYNALSIAPWKRHCDIQRLVLCLEGRGEFMLSFGLHREGRPPAWIGEHPVRLNPGHATLLPIPAWESASEGLLYFRLRALEDGLLTAASYTTPDPAPNAVRLGLVITHFNRQEQVVPAIRRLQAALKARPDLRGGITLTVVDNSRNLGLADEPGLQVIPNENYGGSGGFTRGLLELLGPGLHTHALFMDDDASCETEAVARAFALLQYARDERLAVAGSLLRELKPWMLLEKGARFDGMVRPLCSGLDMRRVKDLLQAETNRVRPDYGAWWFFAFPLRGLRQLPFPFFVRGDDIFFGLGNDFEIATLNGIACLGEDFGAKHGPLTAYLDARYHLVHALLRERRGVSRILLLGRRLGLKALLSYHYASARAFTLAMRHVLQGPDFFREHLDLGAVRREIASWTPGEKMQPVKLADPRLDFPRPRREARLRRLARVLTLQGFLLPRPLLIDRTVVQPKDFHGRAGAVFRYRRVLYHHAPSGTGFLAEHDRTRFFAELGALLRTLGTLLQRLPELRRAYRAGFGDLTSPRFWYSVYGLPECPLPPRAPRDDAAAAAPAELPAASQALP